MEAAQTQTGDSSTRPAEGLRLAIDTIPGLVWSSLPGGHVDFLNQRWLDYTGLQHREAEGWGWQQAVHAEDLPGLLACWKGMLAAGTAGEYEARFQRHDGTYRWFLFRGVLLHDPRGRLVRWYGTNTDIECRRVSEHLARGQVEALTQVLAAISRDPHLQKFLEHVLRVMGQQLSAHSLSVWEMDEQLGRVHLAASFQDGELHLPTREEVRVSERVRRDSPHHPIWSEFFKTGVHCVIGEILLETVRVRIAETPDAEWHDWAADAVINPTSQKLVARLYAQGVVGTLAVPLFIDGRVTGLISLRFVQSRSYRPEELELVRAISHQVVLALQLIRLTEQGNRLAIVAERNRMARDIHDTLAQGFTGVIVQLEAEADATTRGLVKVANGHLARARQLARESLQETRRSVRALRLQALEESSLCDAFAGLVRKMTAGTTVHGTFECRGEPHPLPRGWDESLLRIGQEVLTNALRYANARTFRAELSFGAEVVELALTDDGVGFDLSRQQAGFGLVGIRERAESMGGRLSIDSEPGRGTTVQVDVPLATSEGRSE